MVVEHESNPWFGLISSHSNCVCEPNMDMTKLGATGTLGIWFKIQTQDIGGGHVRVQFVNAVRTRTWLIGLQKYGVWSQLNLGKTKPNANVSIAPITYYISKNFADRLTHWAIFLLFTGSFDEFIDPNEHIKTQWKCVAWYGIVLSYVWDFFREHSTDFLCCYEHLEAIQWL